MSDGKDNLPLVAWDGSTMRVRLPDPSGNVIEANWQVNQTNVVRIRKAGTTDWSAGFETPLAHCQFHGLEPDTEYEVEIRCKSAAGLGAPALAKIHTKPSGAAGNVIPFPRK